MPTYDSQVSRSNAAALMPEEVVAPLLAMVEQQTPFLAMGTRLPNMTRAQTRIPVLASLPVAYFVTGDTGMKQTSNVSWDNKYLDAEEVAVIVPIPENVIDDSEYPIWDQESEAIVAKLCPCMFDARARVHDYRAARKIDGDSGRFWKGQ